MQVSPCCVGKLKFSLIGGNSYSPEGGQWEWRPVMRYSSVEEQQRAVAMVRAAATGGGADAAPLGIGAGREGDAEAAAATAAVATAAEAGATAAGVGAAGVGAAATGAPAPGNRTATEGNSAAETTARTAAAATLVVTHPRSRAFSELLPDAQQQYRMLAQVRHLRGWSCGDCRVRSKAKAFRCGVYKVSDGKPSLPPSFTPRQQTSDASISSNLSPIAPAHCPSSLLGGPCPR